MDVVKIREMSEDAIREEIAVLDKALMDLRMKNAIGTLDNPLEIRHKRKDLARMKTVLSERKHSREEA